jgi:lambda repressor-like predicted transcriptional regulator
MNRKLSPAERTNLAEEYRFGTSALGLARKYKMHRRTVAAHLEREGVAVREQLKVTPRLIEWAKQLYANGQSLSAIGKQLGVEASTVGKALKRAGVKLRPPVADRWYKSRDEQAPGRLVLFRLLLDLPFRHIQKGLGHQTHIWFWSYEWWTEMTRPLGVTPQEPRKQVQASAIGSRARTRLHDTTADSQAIINAISQPFFIFA